MNMCKTITVNDKAKYNSVQYSVSKLLNVRNKQRSGMLHFPNKIFSQYVKLKN